MTDSKPGILSILAAIIGIIGYLIADMFAFSAQTAFSSQSQSFEELLGNTVAGVVLFVIAFVFVVGAMIFSLLGTIWKQSKLIVIISLLAFVPIFVPFGSFTLAAFSSTFDANTLITFLVSWAVLLAVLFLHIKGLQQ